MLSLGKAMVSRDDGKTLIAKARDTVFGRMRAALGERKRKLLTDCAMHATASGRRVRHATAKKANSFLPTAGRRGNQFVKQWPEQAR